MSLNAPRATLDAGLAVTMKNQLLARLPQSEGIRLANYADEASLESRQVLCEPGDVLRQVYFPYDCVVSVLAVMKSGTCVEIAAIGNEGLIGLPVLFGVSTAANRCVVQRAGRALRMRVDHFHEVAQVGTPLHHLMQHYAYSFLVQTCQTAACHTIHSMEKRCCRSLLALQDRMAAAEFPVTQEFLAQTLCVRRATITVIAQKLQAEGLIRYRRGKMLILNRSGLESCACECYAAMRTSYDVALQ